MKKSYLLAISVSLIVASCQDKDEYLPPEWNYEIPQTELKADTELGAFYSIYTDATWTSYQGYTPSLNLVYDEGEVIDTVAYTATQDGILIEQCKLAKQAGIDFFVIPWNNGSTETAFKSAFEFYLDDLSDMHLVINYSFSHIGISESLTAEGATFDKVVNDFKTLYTDLFSKSYYHHLADGRPIVIVSGMTSSKVDWDTFLPAFRQAMKTATDDLRAADSTVSEKALDFYFIGEITSNWAAPVTNEASSKWLDANYVKVWYPSSYYERWYFFFSYTDLAWAHWAEVSKGWGSDFVPCLSPEYRKDDSKARFIDRTEENYTTFCNVAKRNIGKQNVVLINSWNDFTTDSALEPATAYGDTYINLTKKNLTK